MNKTVRDWYFNKLIAALDNSEIRFELHPKAKVGKKKKPECVDGYCQYQKKSDSYLIVIRYRPSSVNFLYTTIHEALHAAFPDWPEQECYGEPIDMVARTLMFMFSTSQHEAILSYLPER